MDFKTLEYKSPSSTDITKTPGAMRSKVLKNLRDILEDPDHCKDFLEEIGKFLSIQPL